MGTVSIVIAAPTSGKKSANAIANASAYFIA
jgi:hypothetical protein